MNEYSISDLAAVMDGNRNNVGGNGWGDGGWWILLLFILLGGFNGNRGWGGGGGQGAGSVGGDALYPWLNNSEQINDGFRDQMLNTTIMGIQQGINGLANQLCNCCGDMQLAMSNGFAGVEQGANARQMANMQQAFASQTAITQGLTGLSQQLADCCCENRLATANQTATILAEHCSDRAALSDGVRDIIAAQTAGTQRIIDQLCQDKIDAKNDEIAQLRQQVQMQQLAASQAAQNTFIAQGFANEVDQLYDRLSNCPVPSMPVYGRTPIFTCQSQNNCGCGCGNM